MQMQKRSCRPACKQKTERSRSTYIRGLSKAFYGHPGALRGATDTDVSRTVRSDTVAKWTTLALVSGAFFRNGFCI